jgi:hypothetical protein
MNFESPRQSAPKSELEQLLSEKRNQRALHASGGDVEERMRLDDEIQELEKKLYH